MEVIKPNLSEAVKAVKSGKILVCPTDTVYGLVCDTANKESMSRLFLIKQRPPNKPIPVFVKDIAMAEELAEISKKQKAFLKKIWPGAVTVVFRSKKDGATIGMRMPQNEFILDIIGEIGRPLAETSANISGQPPTTKIKEVLKYFKGREYGPDLILDAGDLKPAKSSQVIDYTGPEPKVLRK
jgi:L-threonylcarbamoyladenylate synthase